MTRLIWNQVLGFAADAMITVSLAGTVFFAAARSEQKTNVLGYLLVTMVPFAFIAPLIGPVLDRIRHGRRLAMAATALGRAVLAILMARHFDDVLELFPLALGSLVLSKAYSVLRAAAAPRLLPRGMSLVTANARLALFGLAATFTGGGVVAAVIRLTHSYSLGLLSAAGVFTATAYFALRLPSQINASTTGRPGKASVENGADGASRGRVHDWLRRGFEPHVIIALQGESVLRIAAGFLTLFLAFNIEHTSTGSRAVIALIGIGAGAALGQAVGVTLGTRLRLPHPEVVIVSATCICTAAVLITSATLSLASAIACMAVTSATNSLGKLSLDAVIQHDVAESRRSSAFGRSETLLQVAWVLGGGGALLIPTEHGRLGLVGGAVVLLMLTLLLVVRSSTLRRERQRQRSGRRP